MVLTHHLASGRDTARYGYDDLRHFMSRMSGDEKHDAAATSTLDVLWVLYDRILRVDPEHPDHPDRDRFLLSKGHGPMAYYAVLAARGFIDPAILDTFGDHDSMLGHHPDRLLIPGVEISSGSLGQGLALGIGIALGIRQSGSSSRTVVMLGDGEMDEGSVHEAIAVAGRLGLSRLTAVVVDNDSALHGWPGGLDLRFAIEGWVTAVVDGRDHDAIEEALSTPHHDAPLAVVANVEPRDGGRR